MLAYNGMLYLHDSELATTQIQLKIITLIKINQPGTERQYHMLPHVEHYKAKPTKFSSLVVTWS